jgi:putative oxidoreductase
VGCRGPAFAWDGATQHENRGDHRQGPAGLDAFVFGLNPFLKFLPMPPLEGVWGQFLGALWVSHYVWIVGATQVVSGALFLIGRYVPLAIALGGPVIVNIIAYHVTMQHSGAQLAILATICWIILFWWHRASFAPLWVGKPSVQ